MYWITKVSTLRLAAELWNALVECQRSAKRHGSQRGARSSPQIEPLRYQCDLIGVPDPKATQTDRTREQRLVTDSSPLELQALLADGTADVTHAVMLKGPEKVTRAVRAQMATDIATLL